VAQLCINGRYQPLLLLYANADSQLIDVSAALDRNIDIQQQLPASQGPIRLSLL